MVRVKFQSGEQKKFLKEVLEKVNCPSLRAFQQFGFDIPYSTLKNYFNESRLLPKEFFLNLCNFGKMDFSKMNIEFLEESWGQKKGGMKSKKN